MAFKFNPTTGKLDLVNTLPTSVFGDTLLNFGSGYVASPVYSNITNRTMSFFANAGLTTASNIGFPSAPSLTATVTNVPDSNSIFLNHATTPVSGASSGVISAAFTYFRSDWNPKFSAYIKTAADITNIGYWIGMFSATPDNNPTPAISGCAFRYYTSADGTAFWRAVTMDGASQTVTDTGVAIVLSTVYEFYIDVKSTGSVDFYINGVLVATHTTTLPALTTTMGTGVRVTTLEALSKSIRWSRITITHK